jgi:hypothetical protein
MRMPITRLARRLARHSPSLDAALSQIAKAHPRPVPRHDPLSANGERLDPPDWVEPGQMLPISGRRKRH